MHLEGNMFEERLRNDRKQQKRALIERMKQAVEEQRDKADGSFMKTDNGEIEVVLF